MKWKWPVAASSRARVSLPVHGLGGALIAVALLWAFAGVADAMTDHGWLVNLDVGITAWLQAHGTEPGEAVFAIVSWLGAPILVIVLAVAVVIFIKRGECSRARIIMLSTGSGALLNIVLKTVFHRGRPEYAVEFISGSSWSFPSGHAMDSLIGYGLLSYFFVEGMVRSWRRRAVILCTVVVIGGIGFSRIYLGVHYASDVIAGYLAGAVWLLVSISAYHSQKRVRRNREQPTTH